MVCVAMLLFSLLHCISNTFVHYVLRKFCVMSYIFRSAINQISQSFSIILFFSIFICAACIGYEIRILLLWETDFRAKKQLNWRIAWDCQNNDCQTSGRNGPIFLLTFVCFLEMISVVWEYHNLMKATSVETYMILSLSKSDKNRKILQGNIVKQENVYK